MRNRDRVQGIVYMEAIVTPLTWADWPENARRAFQGFRSESGEEMILEQTCSLNGCCQPPSYAGSVRRRWRLTASRSQVRARTAGPRRPRMIPIEGKPADIMPERVRPQKPLAAVVSP